MTEESQNIITPESKDGVSYIFPKSEEIVIHKSDLHIQLDRFKDRIRSSFSTFDLLAIISLWAPVFSADFKNFLGLTSSAVKAGYIVFAILITIFILASRCKYFFLHIKNGNVSSDPEEMTAKILQQCQSKPKSSE